MLTRLLRTPALTCSSRRTSVFARCTAAAERNAELLATPTMPVSSAPATAEASPAVTPVVPPAHDVEVAPQPQAESQTTEPVAAASSPAADATPRRRSNPIKLGPERRGTAPPRPRPGMLRQLVFLEEKPEWFDKEVERVVKECISQKKGFIIRCLGRQGVMGAVNFMVALRKVGLAAEEQWDVQLRFQPQEPVYPYGNPIMMFVDPLKGRRSVRPDNCLRTFTVSQSFAGGLVGVFLKTAKRLKPLEFFRVDTVNVDGLFGAVHALAAMRAELDNQEGGKLVAQIGCHMTPEPVWRIYVRKVGSNRSRQQQSQPAAEQQSQPGSEQ